MSQATVVEVNEQIKTPKAPEIEEQPAVSPPETSSLKIGWREVLDSTAGQEQQKVRSKETLQQEVLVSEGVIEKATEGLKEMALIFGSAEKERNLGAQQQFQAFADILKTVDQEVKFDDPQSVDKAIKTLLERSKG